MNRRTKTRLLTAAQFTVWWAANSLYAIDAQRLLRKFESPSLVLDLVFVQVIVGMLISYAINHLRQARESSNENRTRLRDLKPFAPIAVIIGILHASATTLTNFSYLTIGSSSTLVWKLTEPCSAAVLKKVLLQESTAATSLVGVAFVVAGVLTYSAKDWNVVTFSPIILANILFPTRNAVVKLEQKGQRSDQNICIEQRYFRLLYSSLPFCLLPLLVKIFFEAPILQSFPYLLRNALLFNAYQFASIALLAKLDALTHSLANTMKRFMGILLSAIVLGESFSEKHVIGLLMAAIGFPLYAQGGKLQSKRQFKVGLLGVAVFASMMIVFVDMSPSSARQYESAESIARTFGQRERQTSTIEVAQLNISTTGLAHLKGPSAHLEKQNELAPAEEYAEEKNSTTVDTQAKISTMKQSPSSALAANSTMAEASTPVVSELSTETSGVATEMEKHAAYRDSLRERGSRVFVMAIKYISKLQKRKYMVDQKNILGYRGENLGNLVWEHAAYDVLPDFSSTIVCEKDHYPCALEHSTKEHPRSAAVYWATSNIFETAYGKDFKFFLDMAKVHARIIMVGAGVQADFREEEKSTKDADEQRRMAIENFKHAPENLQFLNMMENNSNPILMRGEMTLQTSRRAGYRHGVSAGCPSLFINKDVRLGQTMQSKYEGLKDRIGDKTLKVGINLQSMEESDEMFLYFIGIYRRYPNSVIFAQSSNDMIRLAKVEVDMSRVRLYQTVEEWRAGMREMEVSFGPRIHGNMVGLAESVPIFVVAPDYRVLELVQRMMIPHLSYYDERMRGDVDVAEVMFSSRLHGEEFDRNRCGIAKLYRRVFEPFGFGVASHVRQISELC